MTVLLGKQNKLFDLKSALHCAVYLQGDLQLVTVHVHVTFIKCLQFEEQGVTVLLCVAF